MQLELHFDEIDHLYTLRDKQGNVVLDLISTTQLMTKHGLSVDYGDVDPEILEQAAQFGIINHAWLEKYFNGEAIKANLPPIASDGVDVIELNGFVPIYSELKVHNGLVAGMIDMVAMKGDIYALIDFKFTYSYNASPIQWQLNIYKHLLKKQYDIDVSELWCLWYSKRNKRFELRKVPIFDNPLVDELFELEAKGELFIDKQTKALDIFERTLAIDNELFKYDKAVEFANKQKEQVELLKEEVYKVMEKEGLRTHYTERYMLTRVLPTSWTDKEGNLVERAGYVKVTERKDKK